MTTDEGEDFWKGIARIAASRWPVGGVPALGTGFLISPRHVLTAAHVVLQIDREGNPPFARVELELVGHRPRPGAAPSSPPRVVLEKIEEFDLVHDWALLRCDIDPPVQHYRLMHRLGERIPRGPWNGYGFPPSEPEAGKAIGGTYKGERARFGSVPDLLCLFTDEAAAGEPVAGCSGGPVFVGREIVGLLRAVRDDEVRRVLVAEATRVDQPEVPAHASGGTIYATRIADVLERLGRDPDRHPEIDRDPTWYVPRIEPPSMPEQPFRGLLPYDAAHRGIYFGRQQTIHNLLRVFRAAPRVPQLVLLHGPAAAGKSSLLAAGVRPYLEQQYSVELRVRLHETLADTLISACRAMTDDRPKIVIIDQAERAFRGKHGKDEVVELIRQIRQLTATGDVRTVVLSYRSEWHAVIAAAAEAPIEAASFLVEPMNHDEVKTALASIERVLQARPYDAFVEPGLFEQISARLGKEHGSLAPIFQVLMSRLWQDAHDRARMRTSETGMHQQPRLDRALFEPMQKRIGLDEYLTKQLAQHDGIRNERAAGLDYAVLRFHTDYDAAKPRTPEEVLAEFGDRDQRVTNLVAALEELKLLTIDDAGVTRLVHDALSPVVCAKWDASNRPGRRAERRIASRLRGGVVDDRSPFSYEDRRVILAGMGGMRQLRPDELLLLLESALIDGEADAVTWYELALERSVPDEAVPASTSGTTTRAITATRLRAALEEHASEPAALRVIAARPELREDGTLRALVLRNAVNLMAKPAEAISTSVTDQQRTEKRELQRDLALSVAAAIADHLLPFRADDLALLRAQETNTVTLRATAELLAQVWLRAGEIAGLSPRMTRAVRERAGIEFRSGRGLESLQIACTQNAVIASALWLAIAFAVCLPAWLRLQGHSLKVMDIGNMIPPLAWGLAVGAFVGPWAMRRTVDGMATRRFEHSWRAMRPKLVAVMIAGAAMMIGFGKAGAQVLRTPTMPDYGLQSAFRDFVISVALASIGCATVVAMLPLVTRLGFTPSVRAGWRSHPATTATVRIMLALVVALGVAGLAGGGLTYVVARALSVERLCRWELPPDGIAAIWIAMMTGLGVIMASMTLGTLHATSFHDERRKLLRDPGVLPEALRTSWWAVVVALALAVGGACLTWRIAGSARSACVVDGGPQRVRPPAFLDAPRCSGGARYGVLQRCSWFRASWVDVDTSGSGRVF